jgi:hypothetical protein
VKLRRRLTPSFADCLFLSLLFWLFASGSGWTVLLGDGDTGWHIRTGDSILAQGSIPARDIFSFSRPGEPWFAWEWLADLIFALLHRFLGLKGVVLLSGVLIAASFTVLFRYSVWRGANLLAALTLTLMAASAAAVHFLARPHIFTFLLLPVSLWLLERDERTPGRAVWLLIPLTALWVNLHGGFLALPACLAVAAGAAGLRAWREGTPQSRAQAKRNGLLLGGCLLATLANPFGWRLHSHIAGYLSSGWIRGAVEEFQSPKFRSESMTQFEVMLLAGLCLVTVLLRRGDWYRAGLILLWAHAALTSVRHVPLFALIVCPILAREVSAGWERVSAGRPAGTAMGALAGLVRDLSRLRGGITVWAPALTLLLVLAGPQASWPTDFPEIKFPVKAVARLLEGGNAPGAKRLLTSDEWGDYLIYRLYPRRKVFIDGRSDFYGPSLGNDYIKLMQGHFEWRRLMDKYGFDSALLPAAWPLAELLKSDPGWRLRYDDGLALYFERISPPVARPLS